MTIITKPEAFEIQPNAIDASQHLFDAFDHSETETSAGWLVRFCQARGQSWNPFTYEEIDAFYQKAGHKDGFTFNRLIEAEMVPPNLARAFAGHIDPKIPVGGGWIIKDDQGRHHFTTEFVKRCFKSSPAQSKSA